MLKVQYVRLLIKNIQKPKYQQKVKKHCSRNVKEVFQLKFACEPAHFLPVGTSRVNNTDTPLVLSAHSEYNRSVNFSKFPS